MLYNPAHCFRWKLAVISLNYRDSYTSQTA